MNIVEALASATEQLRQPSDSARLDAELLLAVVVHQSRTWLLIHPDHRLPAHQVRRFRQLIKQRCHDIPIPYLTGRCMFFNFELQVTPSVLIPRPFTELLVEAVWQDIPLHSQLTMVDIGTGSGAIALALAMHFPLASIIATDISSAALAVARKNAIRLGVSQRISFRRASLIPPILAQPIIIVANLPYLTTKQLREPSIRHEPRLALDGGVRGLVLIRRFLNQVQRLPSVRTIGLEFDPGQLSTIRRLLKQWSPTVRVTTISDGINIRGLRAEK